MGESVPSRIDHDTQAYWQGLKERKLMIARCRDCGHWIHPPRACCPVCWSDEIGHEEPSGKATLFSYLLQPIEQGGAPLVVGWAELSEQDRLFVIAPIEGASAETVSIGEPLRLEWVETGSGPQPAFRQVVVGA